MNVTRTWGRAAVLVLPLAFLAALAWPGGPLNANHAPAASPGYAIDWWTADGGGAPLDGGTYTLMGTAGEPDAGPTLSGGGYALTGGFWGGAARYDTYLPVILLGPK
jgi:hypothetical protein